MLPCTFFNFKWSLPARPFTYGHTHTHTHPYPIRRQTSRLYQPQRNANNKCSKMFIWNMFSTEDLFCFFLIFLFFRVRESTMDFSLWSFPAGMIRQIGLCNFDAIKWVDVRFCGISDHKHLSGVFGSLIYVEINVIDGYPSEVSIRGGHTNGFEFL